LHFRKFTGGDRWWIRKTGGWELIKRLLVTLELGCAMNSPSLTAAQILKDGRLLSAPYSTGSIYFCAFRLCIFQHMRMQFYLKERL
jgi:hypothetical protein